MAFWTILFKTLCCSNDIESHIEIIMNHVNESDSFKYYSEEFQRYQACEGKKSPEHDVRVVIFTLFSSL